MGNCIDKYRLDTVQPVFGGKTIMLDPWKVPAIKPNREEIFEGSPVSMFIHAYKNHFGLLITPDLIHQCLAHSVSSFVDKHHKKLRSVFVIHDKKKLIHSDAGFNPNDIHTIEYTLKELVGKVFEDIKSQEFLNHLSVDFSTSNIIERTNKYLTVLGTLKNYYDYSTIMALCGVPFVEVTGTTTDWEKITQAVKFFKVFFKQLPLELSNDMIKYLDKFDNIVSNLIQTRNGNANTKFWKGLFSATEGYDNCVPYDIFDGWVFDLLLVCSENGSYIQGDTLQEYRLINEIDLIAKRVTFDTFCPYVVKSSFNYKCMELNGTFIVYHDYNISAEIKTADDIL